ncbi:MAG TPA: PAS domain-containing protein, partial [Verrucomicrobiae bacterium]|nr:PAS domain-containing protein [Verrucomicrobiae bacterium]
MADWHDEGMTGMKPRYYRQLHTSVTCCRMKQSADQTSKNERSICFPHDKAVPDETREQAEAALRTGEEHFRELAETIEDVFWVTNPSKSRMFYVSPAYERIWGRSCRSLYDQPDSWLDAVHPEDRERVRCAAMSQSEGSYDEAYRIIRPDMQIRWIRDKAFPVRNVFGQVERVVGIARDITEYLQMTEQLRHSQKMEAIGQLAGGVAHDFNNILAAIILQAELTVTAENFPQEAQDGLRQISLAAERAANLVRQLLLFSRKQMMQARNLDLNEVVSNLAKMVQCVVSENVKLQLHLHPSPLITRADPVMLDQVLINLAVNARDAMPGGGPLLIQTDERIVDDSHAHLHPEAAPGRYVCLSVSDTGTGIPMDILPRI